MTFSSRIKDELSRSEITDIDAAKAEISALVRTMGYINLKGGFNKIEIEFLTENAAVARRIFKLLKMAFNITTQVSVEKTNRLKKNNNYIININDKLSKDFLKETCIADDDFNFMTFDYGIPKKLLINDGCKRAYLRGTFMGCGSISDPEKSYHAEFVNTKEEQSKDLCDLLGEYGIKAKTIFRKNNYVTYIKESEQISDLLALLGANNAVLEFENVRAVKETRNQINRVINCETANLDKIVDTSMRQINSIKVLKKYKVIDKLPDHLKNLAYLRLENENASLKELGEMLDPPLGKSGVNHRLRKIEEIAKDLLEREERGVENNEIAKSNTKK